MRRFDIPLAAAFAAAISCIVGGFAASTYAADLGGPPAKVDAMGNVKSPLSWFAGANIGANFSATQLDSGPLRIDLGTQNYQIGVEGGFDFRLAGPFSIGGLARYDWADAKSSLFGMDAKYNGIWAVAGKLTYHLNAGTELYGLLGYSGTTFKLNDLSDNKRGLMYGAGIEIKLGDSMTSLAIGWDRVTFKEEDIGGVLVKPTVDVVRIGPRIRF